MSIHTPNRRGRIVAAGLLLASLAVPLSAAADHGTSRVIIGASIGGAPHHSPDWRRHHVYRSSAPAWALSRIHGGHHGWHHGWQGRHRGHCLSHGPVRHAHGSAWNRGRTVVWHDAHGRRPARVSRYPDRHEDWGRRHRH